MYTAGEVSCTLDDVLVFFSGADRVPPLGFEKQPSVTFLHDTRSKFATASTCSLELRLPTQYGSHFDKFREAMIMSLMDNDGFGRV